VNANECKRQFRITTATFKTRTKLDTETWQKKYCFFVGTILLQIIATYYFGHKLGGTTTEHYC